VNCYPFIEAEKAGRRNVSRACALLQVSRAAFYAHLSGPSRHEQEDAGLTGQIRAVHDESKGRYGAPRVHAELRRRGRRHGRKRVARLMRRAGIRGRAPKRWRKTTIPDPAAAARADQVRRDFTADAGKINSRWCGDITYIGTWEGWLYLATVIDIASRRVVGYALADHLRTELPAGALANALAARDPAPGVIFHSDRGCPPVHLRRLRLPGQRRRRHAVPGPHRPVLGQRPFRIVLRLRQRRAARPSGLAYPGHSPPGHRRVHRLVQRHPAALHPRIPQPRRIRRRQQDQEGSLTELSALSVKAGQPHAVLQERRHPSSARILKPCVLTVKSARYARVAAPSLQASGPLCAQGFRGRLSEGWHPPSAGCLCS